MRIADELQVDCPVFYIDNVAEYVFQATDGQPSGGRDVMVDLVNSIPALTPPFRDMWMECRFVAHGNAVAMGVRFESYQAGVETVTIACFFRRFGGDVARWPQRLCIVVDENGNNTKVEAIGDDGKRIVSDKHIKGSLCFMLAPFIIAIGFMHCKNVRHIEHEPRGMEAARARKDGRPFVKFYTLEIDPMKETLRREGNVETVGLAKALHICRGHFKDYRQSGLFGKIKGIFWWGPALRGSPEHGMVVKDYAVKAPTETVH